MAGDNLGKNWQSKLRLLDAIDAMRVPATGGHAFAAAERTVDETAVLREKLHSYEQTCAMLEREVQVLEQQTLAALAEAGRLRRELDRSEKERPEERAYGEKDALRKILEDSENERQLLLDALANSESELARMDTTLDLGARRLRVALRGRPRDDDGKTWKTQKPAPTAGFCVYACD
jgi:predicted RNase H-like nuclease (RuvC/YqgF family)